MSDGAKQAIDVLSIGTGLGALVQWLPSIAALLTVIWTAIRIFETPTVQRLLNRNSEEAE
ncbi:MAG: hypothetical protein PHE36_09315 [Novosphingobium sp.]|nr:hypothetical protein [Novosphingobium sp.]